MSNKKKRSDPEVEALSDEDEGKSTDDAFALRDATRESTKQSHETPSNELPQVEKKTSCGKRKPIGKKPADMPRRPLSAYNFFFKDQRSIVLEERRAGRGDDEAGTDLFAALGRTVGERWRSITEDEREKYDDLAARDLVRYRREMDEYSDRIAKRNRQETDEINRKRGQTEEEAASAVASQRDEFRDCDTVSASALGTQSLTSSVHAASLSSNTNLPQRIAMQGPADHSGTWGIHGSSLAGSASMQLGTQQPQHSMQTSQMLPHLQHAYLSGQALARTGGTLHMADTGADPAMAGNLQSALAAARHQGAAFSGFQQQGYQQYLGPHGYVTSGNFASVPSNFFPQQHPLQLGTLSSPIRYNPGSAVSQLDPRHAMLSQYPLTPDQTLRAGGSSNPAVSQALQRKLERQIALQSGGSLHGTTTHRQGFSSSLNNPYGQGQLDQQGTLYYGGSRPSVGFYQGFPSSLDTPPRSNEELLLLLQRQQQLGSLHQQASKDTDAESEGGEQKK